MSRSWPQVCRRVATNVVDSLASAKLQLLFSLFFASLMPFKRHKRAISTKRQKTNCLCYAQSAFFSKSFFTFLRLKKTVKTQLPFKSDIIFFFRMASYVF